MGNGVTGIGSAKSIQREIEGQTNDFGDSLQRSIKLPQLPTWPEIGHSISYDPPVTNRLPKHFDVVMVKQHYLNKGVGNVSNDPFEHKAVASGATLKDVDALYFRDRKTGRMMAIMVPSGLKGVGNVKFDLVLNKSGYPELKPIGTGSEIALEFAKKGKKPPVWMDVDVFRNKYEWLFTNTVGSQPPSWSR